MNPSPSPHGNLYYFYHPGSDLQGWIMLILALAEGALVLVAVFDALRRRPASFTAAGKQTKQRWLIFLGVAGIIALLLLTAILRPINFLSLIAVVAAGVYLADVRPALRQVEGGRGGGGRRPRAGGSSW